jgi:SOS response regulatory protein OraA/RecX
MIVTALRERPRGRVEIHLDGAPWRLVPAGAVVRAGLAVGRPLDRETARALGRELRRDEALGVAVRALRHRDRSRQALDRRLAGQGASAAARSAALETLERAGLVDDARLASGRAEALAAGGYGDAAIRAKLEAEGLEAGLVDESIAALEPEGVRARALLERRGGGVKALRFLAGRGFDVEDLAELAGFADEV